ncbi:tetratricopeptide repeat protein [Nevskia sp.]|uniref:YfgM family protein n=1 Tax=Nevskia sp. TaxID=1929292 RepID=UPI0025F6BD81|nr:tetratricopeptide repeat protein [Nevskia sp.]
MSTHYDDEAQVEDLRRWWKENWLALAIGLGLGLGAIFGWEYYQREKNYTRAQASQLFEELKKATTAKQYDNAASIGDRLIAEFASTPYAVAGAMKLAQAAVAETKLDDARSRLEWAAAHSDDAALKPLIQLRLARVLWQQGKPVDALKLLDGDASTYAVLFEELRGDIKLAEGDRPAALAAYSKALASLGAATTGTPNAPIAEALQEKIDDLADVASVKS